MLESGLARCKDLLGTGGPKLVFFDPLKDAPARMLTLCDIVQECLESASQQVTDLTRSPWPFGDDSIPKFLQAKLKRVILSPSSSINTLVAVAVDAGDTFFVHIANVPQNQSELLAVTLIDASSNTFYSSLPLASSPSWFDSGSSFPRWKSFFEKWGSFYPVELRSQDALKDLAAKREALQGWILDTTAVSHFGHYILNDLGPSIDYAAMVCAHSSDILEIYRRGNIFLCPEAERAVFSSIIDGGECLSPVPRTDSRNEMKRYDGST